MYIIFKWSNIIKRKGYCLLRIIVSFRNQPYNILHNLHIYYKIEIQFTFNFSQFVSFILFWTSQHWYLHHVCFQFSEVV